MKRIGLLTSLAACAFNPAEDASARFHGQVGNSVTHVMAVSPVTGDIKKVLEATVDGTFSVEVETGRPWTLVFVDATRTGSAMVRGVLRSDTLETFNPQISGDIDLGKISIDGRDATMAGSSEELDLALGLSRRTLATIGGLDDLALRYANPDVDGDGLIDMQQGRLAHLEMHLEYSLVASGRDATPDDFIDNASAVNYEHLGTGIYARLPDSFGNVDRLDAEVVFQQPYYGYWAGPNSAPVAAGQPVTHVTYGDDRTFGVFCRPDREIPHGDYTFRSGPHSLEFTLVRPPTEMTLNQVMPRINFVPVDAGCKKDCEIETIDFAWERRTEAGWITLTAEEAQALQPRGSIDMLFSDDSNRRYEFPLGVATGSVPWSHNLYVAQQKHRTGDITYTSVAFQSRTGLKMFATMGDGSKVPRPLGRPDDLSD
jgi:hypothetical protein